MRVWRVSMYPGLSGSGGIQVSGRWHSAPRRVIYAAEHPALAVLESMAHMRLTTEAIPATLKLIAIDVTAGATISTTPTPPANWQAQESVTQLIGDAWLDATANLVLVVPSAVVPHARNVLINPAHEQAPAQLAEAIIEPLKIDPRLHRAQQPGP